MPSKRKRGAGGPTIVTIDEETNKTETGVEASWPTQDGWEGLTTGQRIANISPLSNPVKDEDIAGYSNGMFEANWLVEHQGTLQHAHVQTRAHVHVSPTLTLCPYRQAWDCRVDAGAGKHRVTLRITT